MRHIAIQFVLQVRNVNGIWTETENQCNTKDLSSSEHTMHELRNLHADTHYKIELRAHNKIGFSTPGEIIIKTARGEFNKTHNMEIPYIIKTERK